LDWSNAISPDAILFANDEAATNEMTKMALKMAKPSGVKLAIKTINDAATLLKDERTTQTKIFVITRTIQDALGLVQQLEGQIKKVNIGGVKKNEGAKMLAPGVFLNENDLATLKDLKNYVDVVEFQMVPSESKTDLEKILK
ncbi:MAG: PTS sugar transporter subunit IIB, partial [Anaerorhabdus sp.]